MPFRPDVPTLKSGLNFTLTTTAGDLGLLGEILGVGAYAEVAAGATPMNLYEHEVLVLDLDGLERAKRAAGRLKVLLDLAELKQIRKLRDIRE